MTAPQTLAFIKRAASNAVALGGRRWTSWCRTTSAILRSTIHLLPAQRCIAERYRSRPRRVAAGRRSRRNYTPDTRTAQGAYGAEGHGVRANSTAAIPIAAVRTPSNIPITGRLRFLRDGLEAARSAPKCWV